MKRVDPTAFDQSYAEACKYLSDAANNQSGRDLFILAQCTDLFLFEEAPDREDAGYPDFVEEIRRHGLELRLFRSDGEVKWSRPDIRSEFLMRELTDRIENTGPVGDFFDEELYLDIDTKRTRDLRGKGKIRSSEVISTGGGIYNLPAEKIEDARIRVRNYFRYDLDTGRAFVSDFRIVAIVEGRK